MGKLQQGQMVPPMPQTGSMQSKSQWQGGGNK